MFNRDSAESTAPPLFTSPPSYAVLKIAAQKPQELDVASLPRARLSGHPFSIEHADILLVYRLARLLYSLMIGPLGRRRKPGYELVFKWEFPHAIEALTVGGDDDAASTAEELSGTSATAKNAVEDLPKCVQAELALNLLLCQELPAPSAQLARTGTIHSDLKSCSMEFRSFTFNTSSPNIASFAFLLTLCALVAGSLLFGAYGSSTISF
ncbi:hypothetical protein F5887DRAFT_1074579 [Amanita rubescens]|nr:hypothetical protein F5887DRAFT_1074579 [Amanita rubescens]